MKLENHLLKNPEMNEYTKMTKKLVLIVKNSLNPKFTYTFILEEDDIKRLIEEAEGKRPYTYLEPIELKYSKEYVGEIEESPRLEIRPVYNEKFPYHTITTPKVLENNVIKLDIYIHRSTESVSLESPNILVKISIEDLKNKVLKNSVNSLKFDFGDGVFGEVYFKIPIVPKDPDPIKIVSSSLSYNPGSNGKSIYFEHKCISVCGDSWAVFSFEHETPGGNPIQFVSNAVDLYFINLESSSYIYGVIKIAQELLKSNYGFTTEPLFGERSNRGLFLNVVDSDYNFSVYNIPLVCSDISKVVGKYLSNKWGYLGLRVNTNYLDGPKRFSIELVIRVRR